MTDISRLIQLQKYFRSGATRSVSFRKAQLRQLKSAILQHEEEIYEALAKDLKKSKEESWVTEIGLVIAELNTAIRHLHTWMQPEKVKTNLVNFPSKSRIYAEPLGVVLIIAPWNYPFQLLLNPLVGAIAAGNVVVLKPSEFAPATASVMEKIITEIFPEEYILYIQGEGAAVLQPMMQDFRFDHIFYTGSTTVGRHIYKMAADKLVPVTLELGGKSPCIIEADANLKVAARRIAIAKFSNAGQMCVAPDYVLFHESVKEEFLQQLKIVIEKFFTKDPLHSYNYGKIINEKQFNRIQQYVASGTVVHGGRYDKEKLYIEPTILTGVKISDPVMQEEIFGPVLPVIGFQDKEEALNIIQQNPNPLSLYIYASGSNTIHYWLQNIPAGGVCVNNSSWHITNHHLPFGGRGNSGIGQYHGRFSFDTFSHRKAVMKTPTWFDPAIKYPPFKGKLKLFKKIIK